MRLLLAALMFCLVAGSVTSCVSKKKYDELAASKEATDQALAETQAQVKTLQEDNEELQSKYEEDTQRLNTEIQNVRNEMTSQIASMKDELSATQQELTTLRKEIADMFDAYEAADLSVQERDGDLFIITEAPFTYNSGSARLSSEEREAIDALAVKMKANENLRILVEGHTDSQKFPAGSGYDNWDLSWARAKSVAARLISQGVSPMQVTVAGRGEFNPVDDNGTADGRAANRRTVLKPNPALGEITKAVEGGGGN